MPTELIDKRGRPLTHTFNDLKIGECYQDTDNNICMKIGWDRRMIYLSGEWRPSTFAEREELVIPLKTTITIERCI